MTGAPNDLDAVKAMLWDALDDFGRDFWHADDLAARFPHTASTGRGDVIDITKLAATVLEFFAGREAEKAPATAQHWCLFNAGCSQGCGTKPPVFFCGTENAAIALAGEMTEAEDCYDSTWSKVPVLNAPEPADRPEGSQ